MFFTTYKNSQQKLGVLSISTPLLCKYCCSVTNRLASTLVLKPFFSICRNLPSLSRQLILTDHNSPRFLTGILFFLSCAIIDIAKGHCSIAYTRLLRISFPDRFLRAFLLAIFPLILFYLYIINYHHSLYNLQIFVVRLSCVVQSLF